MWKIINSRSSCVRYLEFIEECPGIFDSESSQVGGSIAQFYSGETEDNFRVLARYDGSYGSGLMTFLNK